MRRLSIVRITCVLAGLLSGACSYAAQIDDGKLALLRKRYESSFESIYVSDSVLNNLAVHFRTSDTLERVTKDGTDAGVVNIFRKFLDDVAKDRAFLQLELRSLRAGFKRQSDPSPAIQPLPWTRDEVFQIALLCDHYLQGQLQLAQLQQKLATGKISVAASWITLDSLRRNPYVPAATMTGSLSHFLVYVKKNPAKVNALATSDPSIYTSVVSFKANVADPNLLSGSHVMVDWPSAVKSEWRVKYKLLVGYGKSTDADSVQEWVQQLDHLQNIEFSKLVASVPSPKIDWQKPAPTGSATQ